MLACVSFSHTANSGEAKKRKLALSVGGVSVVGVPDDITGFLEDQDRGVPCWRLTATISILPSYRSLKKTETVRSESYGSPKWLELAIRADVVEFVGKGVGGRSWAYQKNTPSALDFGRRGFAEQSVEKVRPWSGFVRRSLDADQVFDLLGQSASSDAKTSLDGTDWCIEFVAHFDQRLTVDVKSD